MQLESAVQFHVPLHFLKDSGPETRHRKPPPPLSSRLQQDHALLPTTVLERTLHWPTRARFGIHARIRFFRSAHLSRVTFRLLKRPKRGDRSGNPLRGTCAAKAAALYVSLVLSLCNRPRSPLSPWTRFTSQPAAARRPSGKIVSGITMLCCGITAR